jgi:hypothetical protein
MFLPLFALLPVVAAANGSLQDNKLTHADQETHHRALPKPSRVEYTSTQDFCHFVQLAPTDYDNMFRRKEDTITPDASYPADLKKLG